MKLVIIFLFTTILVSFAQKKGQEKPLAVNQGSYRDIVIEKNLQLVKKNPKNLYAQLELGQIFSQKNRHREAIKYFQNALRISPNSITAIRGMAHAHHRLKDYKNAEVFYKKSLEYDKKDDIAHYGLGTLFYDQNKMDKAKGHFETSIKLNSSNISSRFALGEVYKNKNDCKAAIWHYSQVLKLNEKALLAHFRKGQCEMELGKKKSALETFKRFVEKVERFEPGTWPKKMAMAKHYVNELYRDANGK